MCMCGLLSRTNTFVFNILSCSWSQVAQYLIAFAILFSFGLNFYVPTDILWRKIEHRFSEKRKQIGKIGFRFALALVMICIALAIPNLDPLISLIGAVCFSMLGKMLYKISKFILLCVFSSRIPNTSCY